MARKPGLVIGISLAITAVLGLFATYIKYDYNLLNMQAQELDSVKWEHILINHTSGASWYAISVTATPEEALALKARYEQLPEVGRAVEVASLVPTDQALKHACMRDIQHRLRNLPPRNADLPHALPDPGQITEALAHLRERISKLDPDKVPAVLLPMYLRLHQ